MRLFIVIDPNFSISIDLIRYALSQTSRYRLINFSTKKSLEWQDRKHPPRLSGRRTTLRHSCGFAYPVSKKCIDQISTATSRCRGSLQLPSPRGTARWAECDDLCCQFLPCFLFYGYAAWIFCVGNVLILYTFPIISDQAETVSRRVEKFAELMQSVWLSKNDYERRVRAVCPPSLSFDL